MWPSGQRIRPPCTVERDAPQEPSLKLGPGASAFHRNIISNNSYTHLMNREIIPGRNRGFDGILYNLWQLLTPWVAASRLVATLAWLKLKGVDGHWLVQHTAPVMAKLDGRPCLEGRTINIRQVAHFFHLVNFTHTIAHTYQFPCSPRASALDHYEVSALRSRVGWTPACNKERKTNERTYIVCAH